MSRIIELEKECPCVAKEIESLINTIASYKNIINEKNLSYWYIEKEINKLHKKLEKELKEFL